MIAIRVIRFQTGTYPTGTPTNDWHKLTAHYLYTYYNGITRAGTQQTAPSGAGWAHCNPGSDAEYDTDDPRRVWVRTPAFRDSNLPLDNLTSYTEQINDGSNPNNNDWNTGRFPLAQNSSDHHANFNVWWMYHVPKFDGSYNAQIDNGSYGTRLKNWWEYIFNFNDYNRTDGSFRCPK